MRFRITLRSADNKVDTHEDSDDDRTIQLLVRLAGGLSSLKPGDKFSLTRID